MLFSKMFLYCLDYSRKNDIEMVTLLAHSTHTTIDRTSFKPF